MVPFTTGIPEMYVYWNLIFGVPGLGLQIIMLRYLRRITGSAIRCDITLRTRRFKKVLENTYVLMASNELTTRRLSQQTNSEPELRCTPLSYLVDQKNRISITGLHPGENVTLRARIIGDSRDKYHSFAHFIADGEGNVNVSSQPSVGGSYQGLEPMGLMWSMQPEPGQRKGLRLVKKDVTKPYNVELTAFRGHIMDDDGQGEGPGLCRLTFHKWYMGEGVRRIPVYDGNIRGMLFLPPGNGLFPGVIDLFGTGGGLMEYKASLLASHGFAVLALAYFAYEDLPDTIEDLQLEYFKEAKDWLKNHTQVVPGGIGVMGVSKGSEIAMYLASVSQDIKALVVLSAFYGFCLAPLSYKGQLTKFVGVEASGIVIEKDGGLSLRNAAINVDWNSNVLEDPCMIPVENIQCPALIIYGSDDRNTDCDKSAKRILQRLESCQRDTKQFTVLRYEGAGHLIEPPYSPHFRMSYHKAVKGYLAWGGEPKAHAAAQEDSWRKILEFFAKHLLKEPLSKL